MKIVIIVLPLIQILIIIFYIIAYPLSKFLDWNIENQTENDIFSMFNLKSILQYNFCYGNR